MAKKEFHRGDWVVYRMTKSSVQPGPRAQNITPSEHGDQYTYTVDKFWVVEELQADGKLRLKTRRGKCHVVQPGDPNLHRASWWQRLFLRQTIRVHSGNGQIRRRSLDGNPRCLLTPAWLCESTARSGQV